jgi:anaphase-promoting complex subunit 2
MVDQRFALVKTDISRFFNRLESNAALSRTPDTDQIMLEMLDRLAAWQRAWGSPLRIFNE